MSLACVESEVPEGLVVDDAVWVLLVAALPPEVIAVPPVVAVPRSEFSPVGVELVPVPATDIMTSTPLRSTVSVSLL